MPRDVFGFADHQQTATYSLGYKLTPTRNRDVVVLNKAEAITNARIRYDNIHW